MKRTFWVFSLLLCLFLAACGGPPAPSPAIPNSNPSSSSSTPAPTNSPTVLHVTRTDPSATNNIGSLDKTVTDAQTVQNLYHTALTLPTYAVGSSISQSCLNDTGVIYHLDFLQGSTVVQHMNLDPGNCKILYLSQTDLRQASSAFLNLLQQALQVSSLPAN